MPHNTIQIWYVDLQRSHAELAQLRATLSNDEVARGERLRLAELRRRVWVARGALRAILAAELQCAAADVMFAYGRNGKPAVIGDLRFNVSHSGELALIAIGYRRELGIDIEQVRPYAEVRQITGQFFSPYEQATLHALPSEQWSLGFFNCWTRKEAYLKALGDGFARGLDTFDVTLAPGDVPRLLRVGWDAAEVDRWRMYAWQPAAAYTAALCVAGEGWQVEHRTW